MASWRNGLLAFAAIARWALPVFGLGAALMLLADAAHAAQPFKSTPTYSPPVSAAAAQATATSPSAGQAVASQTAVTQDVQPADDSPSQLAAIRAEAAAYENGEGVPKDMLHAYALYCRAAKAGDAEAQYAVGWMYLNGRGVARDDALAARFFTLAAAQGQAQSRTLLAVAGAPAAELPECMRDPPPPEPPPEDELDDGSSFIAANAEQARVAELVRELAPQFDVSPLLALAVIRAESNFNPNARSPRNAQGLMQLIPETSQRFKVKRPFDMVQNLRGGLAYLRWLLAYFEGNVPLVAAAYNAGEKAVDRYRGVPPYAETRDYVRRVMKVYGKDTHPYDASVTDPSPQAGRLDAAKKP